MKGARQGYQGSIQKGSIDVAGEQSGIIEVTVVFQGEGGSAAQTRQVERGSVVEMCWRRWYGRCFDRTRPLGRSMCRD